MTLACSSAARAHSICGLAWALAAIALASCSTTGASPSKPQPVVDSKEATTIENLLRWSLEGEGGKRKVEAALRRAFEMKSLPARQFSGDGPVRLSDGNILSFAWIGELTGQIDIGVAAEPCVSPGPAAEWIGAQGEVTEDAHGENRGKTYKTQRAGNRIEFTTTPLTYRCIDSINIHPAGKPKQ